MFLSKYGVARKVYVPMIKRAVVDFAVGADWTPAAGDVKVSKDGGAAANVTNLPTAVAMGNTAMWEYSMTTTEMEAAQVKVTVADSATKAVEDQMFVIETYGHASAQHAVDLDDAVRAGLTALPNAAAEAAGGLYTRGAGAGQISQPANGQIDVNTVKVGGTVQTAGDIPARLPAALTGAGNMKSDALAIDGSTTAAALLRRSATQIHDGSVTGAATTTTLIDSSLTHGATDQLKGRIIIFDGNTTANLRDQATDITAFDPALDKLTFTALTDAPAAGDTYVIL